MNYRQVSLPHPELASTEHQQALLEARALRTGERDRERCRRCNSKIPPQKRRQAIYCSEPCKQAYRAEQRDMLRAEIRAAVRSLAPTLCACGAQLDTSLRPGPLPQPPCRRCRDREYRRQRRQEGKR